MPARRSRSACHHTQRPRFSPSIRPASASTFVWWETVGWLLPSGPSNSQEHTSGLEATNDNSRSRTGSARAAITLASAAASASESGASVTDAPQAAGSAAPSFLPLVLAGTATGTLHLLIDSCR